MSPSLLQSGIGGGGEPEGRLGSVPSVERPGAQVPEGEDGRMCSLGTPWDTLMFI